MKNLKAKEIITFIPSGENYEGAIKFYIEIGFDLVWKSSSMSVFKKDNCKFFLQNYPNSWALGNFMMVLEVEDLDHWWEMLSGLGLEEKYEGVKLRSPETYPWGKREIHLIDPCGVLWHISVPA